MSLKNAFTGNRVATYFGLSDGKNVSAAGVINLIYQTIGVALCAALLLFGGTMAISAAGLPTQALLTAVCVLGFFAGSKLLVSIGNIGVKKAASAIPNSALRILVTLPAMLICLTVVMCWPAAFLFLLAKAIPATVSFAGWNAAFTAGFGVLASDTIIGGFTGVSLLAGKREKIIN